ncbi:MAG: GTPase domain-containing protein [Proteobacteria bacterium]|jgi:GTPase SAR1 family protein|nr:GTPase domain-containing protein [Pseudomonadota bacterium]
MKEDFTKIGKTLLLAVIAMIVAIFTIIIAVGELIGVFSTEKFIISALAIFVGLVSVLFFQFFIQKYSVPWSYNVAIVGFPRSGKTTLLISLFGEIFAGMILPIRITPKGTKTIERINESLEMLKKGQALGPTKDQDRFAFRANLTIRRYHFPRTYKVEFGDFPGDESQVYSEKYGSWLHTTEFFKWVVDSDAIIFVIDLGRYLVRDESRIAYVAQISSALRAAWQHFLDSNEHRIQEVRQHPLVLVFTKADLFGVKKDQDTWDLIEQEIAKLGFGEDIPPIKEIDHVGLARGEARVIEDFAEVIRYFETEAPNFQVVFTSSFGLLDGKRLGIKDFLMAVLPRRKIW